MERFSTIRWAQMLKQFRLRMELSKSDLARTAGVSIGYISKLETGKTPPPEHQRKIFCEVLGMTHEEEEQFHIQAEMERTDPVAIKYLMRIAEHKREMRDYEPEVNSTRHPLSRIYSDHMRPIPIINRVGSEYPEEFADPAYLAEIMGQYLMVPDVRDPNAFAFYVFGDTMAPDFPNKTLLISSPNTMAIEGDPCFIHFSPTSRTGGCVFRQIFFTRSQQIRLVPINRHYAEEVYDAQDFLMICPVIRMYGKIIRSEEDQKIGKRLSAISKPYSSQTV